VEASETDAPAGTRRAATSSAGADLETLTRVVERVRSNIKKVIEGKPDVITSVLIGLLAEGHILMEDVPGVG
jgi:MoxR-like ATPase